MFKQNEGLLTFKQHDSTEHMQLLAHSWSLRSLQLNQASMYFPINTQLEKPVCAFVHTSIQRLLEQSTIKAHVQVHVFSFEPIIASCDSATSDVCVKLGIFAI